MATRVIKYQPYRDSDDNYAPLVDFVRRNLVILQSDPRVDVPAEAGGNWDNNEDYSRPLSGWQYGEKTGIKVSLNSELESRADGIAVSGVTVETFGLLEGNSLKIKCERYWYDPRYIELQVDGTESAVVAIGEAFEREFGGAPSLTKEQLRRQLLDSEISVRAGAWEAAKMQAGTVLKQEPDNGAAHFYLGVALAATQQFGEAVPHLERAVEADPKNYDAWYNLANVDLEQGRYEQAVEGFRRALEILPDNHPVFYRMAVALEKVGKRDEAVEAYRNAVRTAPNPGQTWGYSGMDFEVKAREALARLETEA